MTTAYASPDLGFDHVDLNEVDPNVKPVPRDLYTLKIMKAEKREFEYKRGKNIGATGQRVAFRLAVTDHEKQSGRQLFPSLFPSDATFRVLRRLMDTTGVQQEAGTPLETWLATLSEIQPTFKMLVDEVDDVDEKGNPKSYDFKGNVAKINRFDWFGIQPA